MLEWGNTKEQYLFDIAEIESWIVEKHHYINSHTEKVDEISVPIVVGSIKGLLNDMLLYE